MAKRKSETVYCTTMPFALYRDGELMEISFDVGGLLITRNADQRREKILHQKTHEYTVKLIADENTEIPEEAVSLLEIASQLGQIISVDECIEYWAAKGETVYK